MKVLTFSRVFPKNHPKAGEPTWFVEKIYKSIWDNSPGGHNPLYPYWMRYDEAFPLEGIPEENIHQHAPKHHTIRTGQRYKIGDDVSLRVWSGKPYCSPQVEFAQVEIKRIWNFRINESGYFIDDRFLDYADCCRLAINDGLTIEDWESWFAIHPKKKGNEFVGQIICWNDSIHYSK